MNLLRKIIHITKGIRYFRQIAKYYSSKQTQNAARRPPLKAAGRLAARKTPHHPHQLTNNERKNKY
jgi:hypothetical protein